MGQNEELCVDSDLNNLLHSADESMIKKVGLKQNFITFLSCNLIQALFWFWILLFVGQIHYFERTKMDFSKLNDIWNKFMFIVQQNHIFFGDKLLKWLDNK